MGRLPRIDLEGAWHHVMNRGAAHQRIFHGAADGTRFLELVGEGCELTDISVAAYCLMTNHYHLLVHCPAGGLSRFMHRLGSMYTREVNARTGRDGPVFRSRFRSLTVDTDAYLQCAGRYIRRNPFDIRPPVAIDEYRWSSYQYYVGSSTGPSWLSTRELLDGRRGVADYRSFVESNFGRPPVAWAIEIALIETGDPSAGGLPHNRRTVLFAMLNRADVAARMAIEATADLGTAESRVAAMRRVGVRMATDHALCDVADRALHLLGPRCP